MISILSMVSISECIYVVFTPRSVRYLVKSSAIFLVNVVTNVLNPLFVVSKILPYKSSICPFTGLISISGSISPVGRIICSAILVE